jgi:hypothetical protein
MSDVAKKVKDKIVDVKDKAVGSDDREKQTGNTSSIQSDPTREYESAEPMSPAKIKEHEPTAVRRQDNTSGSGSSSTSGQDPKERVRRSEMTEGTAGSTETGDEYEQGAAGTNK